MSLFDPPWYKQLAAIAREHIWPILFAALMIYLAVMMLGCAGSRITPAVNTAETVQTSSGPSERTLITIGKPTVEPKGAK